MQSETAEIRFYSSSNICSVAFLPPQPEEKSWSPPSSRYRTSICCNDKHNIAPYVCTLEVCGQISQQSESHPDFRMFRLAYLSLLMSCVIVHVVFVCGARAVVSLNTSVSEQLKRPERKLSACAPVVLFPLAKRKTPSRRTRASTAANH